MQETKADKSKRRAAVSDPYASALVESIVAGKEMLNLRKSERLFTQGSPADAIYFIQTGKVKVTVVSVQGREAVLAMLGPRDFLGEGCLVGQTVRISSAIALEPSTIFRIEKVAMLKGLQAQAELSEKFVAAVLMRNIDVEENICNQLFNHSEKRLARLLLKLARFGQDDGLPAARMPQLSHQTLAEMVGTTRARITYFMNKFRKLGLIDCNGALTVRTELLTDVVLHD